MTPIAFYNVLQLTNMATLIVFAIFMAPGSIQICRNEYYALQLMVNVLLQ